MCCLPEARHNNKGTKWLKVKDRERFSMVYRPQKATIAILIPDKANSKDRNVTKEREAGRGNGRDGSDVRSTSWGLEQRSQAPPNKVGV